MYCRKCGKGFDDELNVCPFCETEVITKDNLEDASQTDAGKIPDDSSSACLKKIIVAFALLLIVCIIAAVFLTGGKEGTFENYSWDMTKAQVVQEAEKNGYEDTSRESDTAVLFIDNFWGLTGYEAMVGFSFEDTDQTLSEVNIFVTGDQSEDLKSVYDYYFKILKKAYGSTYDTSTDGSMDYECASWKTKTGEVEIMTFSGFVVINYFQER